MSRASAGAGAAIRANPANELDSQLSAGRDINPEAET